MQPKLKENPREWLKFTAVMAVVAGMLLFGAYWRGWIPRPGLFAGWLLLAAVVGVCALKPRWFRSFYRAGMTASFQVGQVMGQVLLTLMFLVVVTPLGCLLRLLGKDLLKLKRDPAVQTYWQPARPDPRFDRQF